MKEYKAENIINFVLAGHASSGKTSLAESFSFCSGAIRQKGSIQSGNTLSDYRKQEIDIQHSISMSLINFEYLDKKFNLIDTPGYIDFVGEMKAGLGVADLAGIVVNASEGIEVGTELAWEFSSNNETAKFIVINMCDRDQSDFDKSLNALKKRFGRQIFPINFPLEQGVGFNKIADVLKREILDFSKDSSGNFSTEQADDATKNKLDKHYEELIELVAESDEALLESFFEKGELSENELKKGLKNAIISKNLIPVFCSSGEKNVGSKRIIEFLAKYAISSSDIKFHNAKDMSDNDIEVNKTDSDLSAYVFKTLSEEHVGELSFFKVCSGKLSTGQSVMNTSKNVTERLRQLYFVNGKNRKDVSEIIAGDIGAVLKLKDTHAGNTLTSIKKQFIFNSISYPNPNVNFSIEAESRGIEDKMATGLATMHEEDPTFLYRFDPEIKQTIISGQGELHINLILDKIKTRFGVGIKKSKPKIPYRETITSDSQAKYRHKKQSGGSGQFAEVWLKIAAGDRGTGVDFKQSLVGQNVDRSFVTSVEKGINTICEDGIIAGCNVVDIKIDFYDGKMHPVDSNDMAFQIAGKNAFIDAFKQATPKLLEPIYKLKIKVPEDVMGDIMGDVSQRRGKVSGMGAEGHFQVINAEIPLANLHDYATALKSMSGGRGMFSQEFSHYEDMPHNEAEKVKNDYQAARSSGNEE